MLVGVRCLGAAFRFLVELRRLGLVELVGSVRGVLGRDQVVVRQTVDGGLDRARENAAACGSGQEVLGREVAGALRLGIIEGRARPVLAGGVIVNTEPGTGADGRGAGQGEQGQQTRQLHTDRSVSMSLNVYFVCMFLAAAFTRAQVSFLLIGVWVLV